VGGTERSLGDGAEADQRDGESRGRVLPGAVEVGSQGKGVRFP